jgi:hypothetical protein
VTGASAPGLEEVARAKQAVNREGARVVATTVHPLQVLAEALPETDHDFRLDLIVAGEEVIPCRRPRRPQGILWYHLDAAKITAIPPLAARTRQDRTLRP